MCTKGKNANYPRIKSFLKDYPNPVYNSLLGNTVTNRNLVVLENHNIIMRRDHKEMRGKVKIIGGGGAGLEPAEASYVGKGMLTAAVFGEMFSAPSAEEVLLAIRELASENSDSILLLVKNYIGDKLNFGLALDRALNESLRVKMLVLGDDACEPVPQNHGRKALAGNVLVYKIAGEMAEQEKSLEEIIEECRGNILTDLATASVTLPVCGKTFCESLSPFVEPDEMILGMGVYGQQGRKKIKFCNVGQAVSVVLNEIFAFAKENFELEEGKVVVLVNNHGSTSKFEESIIAMEVAKQLWEGGVKVALLYSGTFMSGANTNGFSVTVLKINSPYTLRYLEAPTSAPAWPKPQPFDFDDGKEALLNSAGIVPPGHRSIPPSDLRCEGTSPGPSLSPKGVSALKQIAMFAAEALISCEKQLNIIDSETGDGDAGTVLRRGADALKKALMADRINVVNPGKFLLELGDLCSKSMGGLSGALYAVFFDSAGKVIQRAEEITPDVCSAAFKAAVESIKRHGKAEPGERTMMDVLCPTVDAFESAVKNGKELAEAIYLAAAQCEFKSEETKSLRPQWQKNMEIKKPLLYADAGAHAATIWLRAISEGFRLNYPSFEEEVPTRKPGIFLWKFLTEEDCEDLLRDDLSPTHFISHVEKKIGDDQTLLAVLLNESFKYCRMQFGKEPRKTSALIGSVYYSHIYFTASGWRKPSQVYHYFRESILCQSVESPPVSTEIFDPEEAKNALLFFLEMYIRNLPLVRVIHLPHYKLELKLKNPIGNPLDPNDTKF